MVRVGIVGTNFISEWFTAAAHRTGGRVRPVGVFSRSAKRAAAFAAEHEIPYGFDDLVTMIEAVDAVYIASPTIAHYPQAMTAIDAGRHVLVEKTITASHAEAVSLFARADEQGVVAMEATRHLHTPEYAIIRDALGRLGTIRYAHIEMLQYSSRYDRFREGERMNAFDPALGNSALVDIGVYCLEPAIDLFGTPISHSGASTFLENGFEGGGSIQLDYGSMVANLAYSKIAHGTRVSTIAGEEGSLTIESIAETGRIVLRDRSGETVLLDTARPSPAATMDHELLVFADQVEAGRIDPRWRDITLTTRRIMDEHLGRN